MQYKNLVSYGETEMKQSVMFPMVGATLNAALLAFNLTIMAASPVWIPTIHVAAAALAALGLFSSWMVARWRGLL